MVVALTEEVAFEALHAASEDADAVAVAERGVGEGDWRVGMVEHELEGRHLRVGDYGKGGSAVGVGLACTVKHEALDVGTVLEDFEAFLFGDVDKNGACDDDMLDFTAVTIAIDAGLLLTCHVCFVAHLKEVHTAYALVIAADNGYKPLAVWYASGTRLAHCLLHRCANAWLW